MSQNLPMALFTSDDGKVRLQLSLVENTIWLTQKQLADLYEKSPPTINEHLKNIYEDGELQPEATIRKFRIVAREGPRDVEQLLDHYNLEAVLAVGYRVRSNRGTPFRQWASQVLLEVLKDCRRRMEHSGLPGQLLAKPLQPWRASLSKRC